MTDAEIDLLFYQLGRQAEFFSDGPDKAQLKAAFINQNTFTRVLRVLSTYDNGTYSIGLPQNHAQLKAFLNDHLSDVSIDEGIRTERYTQFICSFSYPVSSKTEELLEEIHHEAGLTCLINQLDERKPLHMECLSHFKETLGKLSSSIRPSVKQTQVLVTHFCGDDTEHTERFKKLVREKRISLCCFTLLRCLKDACTAKNLDLARHIVDMQPIILKFPAKNLHELPIASYCLMLAEHDSGELFLKAVAFTKSIPYLRALHDHVVPGTTLPDELKRSLCGQIEARLSTGTDLTELGFDNITVPAALRAKHLLFLKLESLKHVPGEKINQDFIRARWPSAFPDICVAQLLRVYFVWIRLSIF